MTPISSSVNRRVTTIVPCCWSLSVFLQIKEICRSEHYALSASSDTLSSDSPQLLQQGKHTPEGSYSPHSTVPCIECACLTWTATTTAGPSTSQHMMLTPMDGSQIGCTLILLVCNIYGFVIHLSMENRLSDFTVYSCWSLTGLVWGVNVVP